MPDTYAPRQTAAEQQERRARSTAAARAEAHGLTGNPWPLWQQFIRTVRFWRAHGLVLDADAIGFEEMQRWQAMALDVLVVMGWTWADHQHATGGPWTFDGFVPDASAATFRAQRVGAQDAVSRQAVA